MKSFLLLIVPALILQVSCGPQAAAPEQLRTAHEQNARMRSEIVRMHTLIEQAGEDVPHLEENIAAKEKELTQLLMELDSLNKQETEARLRVIELQDRLDSFRASFRIMQNEIANQHTRH